MNFYHTRMVNTEETCGMIEEDGGVSETIVYTVPEEFRPHTGALRPYRDPSFGHFSEELWSCHILLYCELPSLMRLNWTSKGLRQILNNPLYVQMWQRHAWFLTPSGCPCQRGNTFLNLKRFPDFVYDCHQLTSMRELDVALRGVGRSLDMYYDSLRDVHRVPFLDPNREPQCFKRGLVSCWMEYLLIPMPRMLPCHVEDAHDDSRTPVAWRTVYRMDGESNEQFVHRKYWRGHHHVPTPNVEEEDTETVLVYDSDADDRVDEASVMATDGDHNDRVVATAERPREPIHPVRVLNDDEGYRLEPLITDLDNGFGDIPSANLLHHWQWICQQNGWNYLDPAQDDDMLTSSRLVRWARRLLYETPVGVQSYPTLMCLKRSQMSGRAYRSGTDYLEYLFLPTLRGTTPPAAFESDECRMLMHHGPVFFHPVRYENERGDFCNWALSTLSVMRAVERYLWYDSINYVIRRVVEASSELAMEVQVDMAPRRLAQRWSDLQRACFFNQRTWPEIPNTPGNETQEARQRIHDAQALDLIFSATYVEFNRTITQYVDRIRTGEAIESTRGYLLNLIPNVNRVHAGQRSEATLVRELHDSVRLLNYITLFATNVGPLTDGLTERRRLEHLYAWIGCAASLLMFAPGWMRPLTWEPSVTGTTSGSRVPHIVVEQNHRFQELLLFLNRRTLFYHPEPNLYQYWQNRNLEVGRPLHAAQN